MSTNYKKITYNQLGRLIVEEEIHLALESVKYGESTRQDCDTHVKMVKECFKGVKDLDDIMKALSDIGYCDKEAMVERILDTLIR